MAFLHPVLPLLKCQIQEVIWNLKLNSNSVIEIKIQETVVQSFEQPFLQ